MSVENVKLPKTFTHYSAYMSCVVTYEVSMFNRYSQWVHSETNLPKPAYNMLSPEAAVNFMEHVFAAIEESLSYH